MEKLSTSNGNTGIIRKYGAVTATAIVVANMVGAGIFTTSGIMASNLPGAGWVLLCWIGGGMIALSGALCYSELATRMPLGGGEYVYLKKLYHPSLGFLTGWTSFFVGFSAPIALSALGCAEYLFAGFANVLPEMDPGQAALYKKFVAIAIISVFTGIHYVGGKLGPGVQNFLTAVKILIIVGLAFSGLIFGRGDWSNISLDISGESGNIAIGTAMIMVMFSYCGWNAASYIAGELKRPKRTLPVSLVAGTLIVIVLYVIINLFIFYSAPYGDLKGVVTVVDTAASHSFVNWPSHLLGIMISVIMLSSLSAFIMIGPRVYHAMAEDGLFFSFASKIHPKFKVPSRSIFIQGIMALIMVFAGTIEQLLIYVGFALGIFPWLAIAGIYIARKRHIGDESAVKVWGYPYVPIFFLVSSLLLMIFTYVNRPLESTAAVVTVALGMPCYLLWVKFVKNKKF